MMVETPDVVGAEAGNPTMFEKQWPEHRKVKPPTRLRYCRSVKQTLELPAVREELARVSPVRRRLVAARPHTVKPQRNAEALVGNVD